MKITHPFVLSASHFLIYQNIWYSINANIANGVARSRNITLGVFPGGYPPCGVPLFDNFDVDMGRYSGYSSGITGQNKVLNKEWGTMVRLLCFLLCVRD